MASHTYVIVKTELPESRKMVAPRHGQSDSSIVCGGVYKSGAQPRYAWDRRRRDACALKNSGAPLRARSGLRAGRAALGVAASARVETSAPYPRPLELGRLLLVGFAPLQNTTALNR
mmetsp:Transcript_25631/g.76960  ORF Transcript_25631/g.76960 Transcript_25631/m.76960 type:complete len:117 (-) Transcript_25631:89-439(-)